MMATNFVDLKLDRAKLNPNFDEYKLSLDGIPCYKLALESKPENVQLSDKQFSLQHVKAFGNQNTLFHDPWISNVVYFIDERWKVMKFRVSQESKLEEPKSLLQIPGAKERGINKERICASLSFASAEWAFLANGSGKLYIVDTFSRQEDLMWKICHSCEPVEEGTPFKLLHSVCHVEGGVQILDCLIVHVESSEPSDQSTRKSPFTTQLEWLTFGQVEGSAEQTFALRRVRRLEGEASADYCALQPGAQTVDLASERPFKLVYDSVNPVKSDNVDVKKQDEEADFEEITAPKEVTGGCYYWSQSEEDVTVFITLPPNACKADLNVAIKPRHLKVALNSGEVLLTGSPHGDIDVDGSTWIVTNEEIKSAVGEFVRPDQLRLQIILAKKSDERWTEALNESDKRGVFVVDEKQMADIKEGLDHLTSDKMNPEPQENMEPAYNVQELEDCDVYPDQNSVLQRVDGQSHQVTHQVNLGNHQWLFNVQSGESPCLCVRHDVDGIVWQPDADLPDPSHSPWSHLATFDAFGYVHASKQQRKFTACAPDFSYALVCDSVRHMYVYRQPTPTETALRNRKTGRQVNSVAKQQLISLESVDTITGLFAANNCIFAVAGDTVHVLRLA